MKAVQSASTPGQAARKDFCCEERSSPRRPGFGSAPVMHSAPEIRGGIFREQRIEYSEPLVSQSTAGPLEQTNHGP
jgi:hypothetical protein